MAIGHPSCIGCRVSPTFQLQPCGCTACFDHFQDNLLEAEMVCGTCYAPVLELKQLQPTPPFDASETAIRPQRPREPSRLSGQASAFLSAQANTFTMPSASNTHSRDGQGPPPARIQGNTNTTSTGQGAPNNASSSGAAPRYVPPHLREHSETTFDLPLRPSSSMSNASFATQPPLIVDPPAPGVQGSSSLFTTPDTSTMYGIESLNQRFASYNPFLATPNTAAGHNSTASSSQHATRSGLQSLLFPYGSTGHNAHPSLSGSGSAQSTMSTPTPYGVSNTNVRGFEMSRAVHLASLIRSGATDNPLDIDYGNPGRSKRLPPEPVDAPPVMPRARGKVDVGGVPVQIEASTKGNPAVYLGVTDIKLPEWFSHMRSGYQPTLEEVFNALPVVEACRVAKPSTAGVVKISNIPYSSSRSEVVAFLGRTAQINCQPEGSPYLAIHILIDRQDGKTIDAYAEVKNTREAKTIAEQFERRIQSGRHAKMGDREVKVEAITQGAMLAEIFPHGKDLVWLEDGTPVVSEIKEQFYEGVPSVGFIGFIRQEDLSMMSKFAETPQRSPFVQRHMVRPYEHLITMLHKYPWHSVENVYIKERNAIFDVAVRSTRALMDCLRKTHNNTRRDNNLPTTNTLQELVVATLTCPGFSEGQKSIILQNLEQAGFMGMAHPRGMNLRLGGTDKHAREWPFVALVKQPGSQDLMVEYMAGLLRQATDDSSTLSLADLHSLRSANAQPAFFGKLRMDYRDTKTLADVAGAELRALEVTLSRVLLRGHSSSSGGSRSGARSRASTFV